MREIEVPEGVTVNANGNEFTVKGNGKEAVKAFDLGKIQAEVKDGKVVLVAKGATRRESKMMGTTWAHLKNMIKGVGEDLTESSTPFAELWQDVNTESIYYVKDAKKA